jgi:predicted metal-dependent hydrolase
MEPPFNYTLKVSKRAKRMRLTVYCDGSCVVTTPRLLPQTTIENFLLEKAKWVVDKINNFRAKGFVPRKKSSRGEFTTYKAQALWLAKERIEHFNTLYGYSWNKITIKNQKTRWGSCSRKGNINFNYKIALLPPHMADYIIVHELCHLGEFNHSKNFWNLVAMALPNYLEIRNEFKVRGIKF